MLRGIENRIVSLELFVSQCVQRHVHIRTNPRAQRDVLCTPSNVFVKFVYWVNISMNFLWTHGDFVNLTNIR